MKILPLFLVATFAAAISILDTCQAQVLISEFVAANSNGLLDEDGDSSDWIEIFNAGDEEVDLQGWHLTDRADKLTNWTFPEVILEAGGYMTVFASGKDRADSGSQLHTDFQLDAGGEYLALVHPDGITIASEFGPNGTPYPEQFEDISFGVGEMQEISYVTTGNDVSVLIPQDDSLGSTWTGGDEDTFAEDESWISGTTAVGYDTEGGQPSAVINIDFNTNIGVTELKPYAGASANGPIASGSVWNQFTLSSPPNGQSMNNLLDDSGTETAVNVAFGTGWAGSYNNRTPNNLQADRAYTYGGGTGTFTVSGLTPGGTYNLALFVDNNSSGSIATDFTIGATTMMAFGGSAGTDVNGPLTFTAGVTHALFSGISASVDGDITISTTQAAGATFGSFPGLQIEGSFPVGPVTHLGTDVQTDMHGINASAYLRIPFEIGGDPQEFTDLTLRMQYDDGFVAYLNGTEIARRNAPTAVGVPPAYNAAASIAHPDEQAVVFEDIDITAHVDKLLSGSNILAIHGLNEGAGDNDFLILPELVVARNVAGYIFAPTPGQTNSQISQRVGPLISGVSHGPARPSGADDLVVTATLTEAPEAVASATLHYRVMFGPEFAVPMFDDGTHGDAAAGDGVYGAIVTAADLDAALVASGSPSGTLAGRMVRYYITAADLSDVASRAPAFVQSDDSPEYFGTVAADPSVTTELPVLEWFVQDEPATRTRAGTRASLFYAGEFFDNVFVRIRGRVSTRYPKNSFKFQFNAGNHFRFSPDHPRVDEINVNNTYNDKAYIRPVLAFEALDDAGAASPSAFNMRVNQNAEFHSVAVFVEQVDRDFLRRQDLDPDGALYKFAENASGGVRFAVAEKKTRKDEGLDDLQDLVDGVHPTNANRGEYVFDNLDVAQIVNYMATMQVIMDVDYTAKNFYMHRDTEGTGLWSIIPWDKDLTFGAPCSIACGGSSDVILADNDATGGTFGPPAAPTHPFFGSVQYSATSSFQAPNHVMDAVINNPVTREMYLRRLRTLMDQLLKPTGTPQEELYFENRADELEALLGPDALLDAARWANPWPWGANYNLARAIDAITDDYLPRRRTHLYQTHSIDNLANYPDSAGIPHAQSGNLQIDFGPIDYNPVSGIQDEEYIQLDNPNGVAVDISGWELTGGVEHTFRPGTVIPGGGSLYVTPDVLTFLDRATGPSGGQELFVQGSYKGHISNVGEVIDLVAPDLEIVATVVTPSDPSDAQLYLVVSEIMYHPDEGLAEFIELTNISTTETLDLSGVKFVDGIDFDFTGSAVTSLAPGDRVLVVRDTAAFTVAHGSGYPVAGVFANTTKLSNDGETIKLEDAGNSTIKEFTYNDAPPWPIAGDAGYSLVLIDPTSNPDPDIAANWRSSALPGGNPDGTDIVTFPANPLGDDDGNGTADLVDYATGADLGLPALALAVSSETYDIAGSMQTLLTLSYPISLGAEGASIHIDASTDLSTWIDAAPNTEFVSQTNLGDGRAMVTVHFTSPIGDGPQHFLRLRVEQL